MLPTAYPYDRRVLLEHWKQFVTQGTCNTEGLDPVVVRSWRRCREAGLSPLDLRPVKSYDTPEELELRAQAHFDLIAVARPFMEDIYQYTGEQNVVVSITDRELCLLHMAGDAELMHMLKSAGMEEGVRLAENMIGTNAAALAVNEGMPVQVVGPEHYASHLQCLTGSAAPIHAPQGELLSVLEIITPESNGHPHTLGIAMAAAKAIENQLRTDLSLSEAHEHLKQAAELEQALEAMSTGFLRMDETGKVTHINARASEILGISRRFTLGRALSTQITLPLLLESAIAQFAPIYDREVVFQTRDGPRPCVVSMQVLWHGSHPNGFTLKLERPAEVRQLVHRIVGLRAHFTFDDIVCQDVDMRWTVQYARAAAQDDSNVLLMGESGTGKELFAHAIHSASRRAGGPFVRINCEAVAREMMAFEVFGHEGTYPGIEEEAHPGKFELADGGTIFLDHVERLSLDAQAGLLHIIDTHEITRLGGTRTIPLDVRVIAATSHPDLNDEVQRGRFRADLYYRLHVITLTIPPLCQRGNDVQLLANHLVQKLGQRLGKSVTISSGAASLLQAYRWPGNVRELESVIERAMHLVTGDVLTPEYLPHEVCATGGGASPGRLLTLPEAERQAIIVAGRALRGNVTKMSDVLGIGRTTLWRKMRAYGITANSFKG